MIPEIDLWHDGRGKRAILSKDESVPCNSSMPHRLLYFHPSSLEGIPNPNDESKLTYLPVPYRRDGEISYSGTIMSTSTELWGIPDRFKHLFPKDNTPGTFVYVDDPGIGASVSRDVEHSVVDIGSRHYDSDKLARPASTAERRADRIPTKRQEQRALCRGKSDLGRGSVTRISSGHDVRLRRKDEFESESEPEEEFNDTEADIMGREAKPSGNVMRGRDQKTLKRQCGEERRRKEYTPGVSSGSRLNFEIPRKPGENKPMEGQAPGRQSVVSCVSDGSKDSGVDDICDTDSDDVTLGRMVGNHGDGRRERMGGSRGGELLSTGRADPAIPRKHGYSSRTGGNILEGSRMNARSLSSSSSSALGTSKSTIPAVTNDNRRELASQGQRERSAGIGSMDARSDMVSRRPASKSSDPKTLRIVPARSDDSGWIGKGKVDDPVSSFKGPQAALRKNKERNLKQKKLGFRPVGAAAKNRYSDDTDDDDIEEIF